MHKDTTHTDYYLQFLKMYKISGLTRNKIASILRRYAQKNGLPYQKIPEQTVSRMLAPREKTSAMKVGRWCVLALKNHILDQQKNKKNFFKKNEKKA